jgi:hypothetical protein
VHSNVTRVVAKFRTLTRRRGGRRAEPKQQAQAEGSEEEAPEEAFPDPDPWDGEAMEEVEQAQPDSPKLVATQARLRNEEKVAESRKSRRIAKEAQNRRRSQILRGSTCTQCGGGSTHTRFWWSRCCARIWCDSRAINVERLWHHARAAAGAPQRLGGAVVPRGRRRVLRQPPQRERANLGAPYHCCSPKV